MAISWLARLSAVGLLLASSVASAVTLAETNPLFFPLGGANTGFDPVAVGSSGVPIGWDSNPASSFLCAGTSGTFQPIGACAGKQGFDIEITLQDLQRPVDQNPQERPIPSDPTPLDPFIGTSFWTATNSSGADFTLPAVLIFTNIDLSDFPGNLLGGPYPDVEVGLDANLFQIVRQTVPQPAGPDLAFFYGGVSLGTLAAGEEITFPVRYIVNGPLPFGPDIVPPPGADLVMPPIALLGLAIPEPTTALLLGAGLAALGAARRERQWR